MSEPRQPLLKCGREEGQGKGLEDRKDGAGPTSSQWDSRCAGSMTPGASGHDLAREH